MSQTQISRNTKQIPPSNTPPKILAIEDDQEVIALYKSYLTKRGYEVVGTSGAVDGMRLLASNPDTKLVILDLNLPGMSGDVWLAWFLETQKSNQAKVVVCSGSGRILTVSKGNNGISALSKPFHMEELWELIEVVIAPDWENQVSNERCLH